MRECERCGRGSWFSRSSGDSVRDVAFILTSLRSLLLKREHLHHVQILPVVAGFRDNKTAEIQLEPLFDVLGLDLVPGFGDLGGELFGGAEDLRMSQSSKPSAQSLSIRPIRYLPNTLVRHGPAQLPSDPVLFPCSCKLARLGHDPGNSRSA